MEMKREHMVVSKKAFWRAARRQKKPQVLELISEFYNLVTTNFQEAISAKANGFR
jgi:hypothetical protein